MEKCEKKTVRKGNIWPFYKPQKNTLIRFIFINKIVTEVEAGGEDEER